MNLLQQGTSASVAMGNKLQKNREKTVKKAF